jgi:hypothetical protein
VGLIRAQFAPELWDDMLQLSMCLFATVRLPVYAIYLVNTLVYIRKCRK